MHIDQWVMLFCQAYPQVPVESAGKIYWSANRLRWRPFRNKFLQFDPHAKGTAWEWWATARRGVGRDAIAKVVKRKAWRKAYYAKRKVAQDRVFQQGLKEAAALAKAMRARAGIKEIDV